MLSEQTPVSPNTSSMRSKRSEESRQSSVSLSETDDEAASEGVAAGSSPPLKEKLFWERSDDTKRQIRNSSLRQTEDDKSGGEKTENSLSVKSKLPSALGSRDKRPNGEFIAGDRPYRKSVDSSWVSGNSQLTIGENTFVISPSNVARLNSTTRQSLILGSVRAGDSPESRKNSGLLASRKQPHEYTVDELCILAWEAKDIPRFREIATGFPKDKINEYNTRGQTALYCAARYAFEWSCL